MMSATPTDTTVRRGLGCSGHGASGRRLWGELRNRWWSDFQRQLHLRDLGMWRSVVGVATQEGETVGSSRPPAHAPELSTPLASVWSSPLPTCSGAKLTGGSLGCSQETKQHSLLKKKKREGMGGAFPGFLLWEVLKNTDRMQSDAFSPYCEIVDILVFSLSVALCVSQFFLSRLPPLHKNKPGLQGRRKFNQFKYGFKGLCLNNLISKQVRIVQPSVEWIAAWVRSDDFLAKGQNFVDYCPGSPERHCMLWGK